MLYFGVLPPEINSGRMYAGPGPESMLVAAMAWDGLAADLRAAAGTYQSVISGLTSGRWLGPSSVSMAAAAAPYRSWMDTTAAQAEEAATKAKAAAAAFETAFAATVPPPVIAANRALLMALIATNFFGQNSPAIAATEAQYAEMWAQDADAMYGYAGASAAASTMTPFTPPPRTTNPVGPANQVAAVTKAAGTPAGSAAQTIASTATPQLASASALPQTLQQVSSAAPSTSPLDSLLTLLGLDKGLSAPPSWLVGPNGLIAALSTGTLGAGTWNALTFITSKGSFGSSQLNFKWLPTPASAAPAAALPHPGSVGTPGGAGVSAGVGKAGTIGRLSVPSAWAAAAPAQTSTSAPALLNTQAAADVHPNANGLLRGMPLLGTGMGRRAAGGFTHHYGFRHAVMPRPPAGG